MPKGIYSNYQCRGETHPLFNPTRHQKDTLKAFMKSKYKGLLLYHKLGSGKTCTSILIADKMLKKKKVKKVYVLTSGSLRAGWVNEYCNVCGGDRDYLQKKYTFVTYNYMIGRRLPDFSNSLVIIDEVHNLINGAKNQSFHPTQIYNALLGCNKCRILALSGTPVHNYVYEFALLGRLLKGNEFPDIRRNGEIDSLEFMKFFTEEKDGTLKPKNTKTIKKLLEGIVSYYPGAGEEYVPRIIEMEPIKVVMTKYQEENYWKKQIQEIKLSHPPNKKLLKEDKSKYQLLQRLYIMAKKNILTRAASNFYYPKEVYIKTTLQLLENDIEEYSDSDISDENIPKDLLVKNGGWIRKKWFKNGKLYKIFSTKITALILNIILHNTQKHVLFTFFKNKSGVYLIKSLLEMCGIKSEIFSGDLDDRQRKEILRRFNSPDNTYGEKIRILLVTEAGSEGISVLEARHMHILESSPRMNKTIQAIGRVARYKSHIRLPKNEQTVKVWKYWSIACPEPVTITTTTIDSEGKEETSTQVIENKETIDEILYEKGMKVIREVNSFLDILKEVSVTPYKKNILFYNKIR